MTALDLYVIILLSVPVMYEKHYFHHTLKIEKLTLP